MSSKLPPFTTLLQDWRRGDSKAAEQVLAAVYQELRRLAAHYLRQERPDHTLQPTALVHEMYLRLCASQPVDWQSRAHFFAVAAQQLRRILINHARDRQSVKRGGKQMKLALNDVNGLAGDHEGDLLEVHEALDRLAKLDARAAQVVELRFFGGLTELEAAEVLGISTATVKRDWDFARAWLLGQLRLKSS
jgi:RNA polymerase sigma factor (TIGR02999 family)